MEFKQYLGKLIVAWLWYNPVYEERFGSTNIVCYIYPRFLLNEAFEKVNAEDDFPENGRMEVFIQGGQSAKEVFEQFGPLVSVRLNREIAPNYKGHNRYRLNYNPQYGAFSDITIERLSEKKFFQVLETDANFGTLQKTRFLDRPEGKPFIDRILIQNGSSLYGPFEYEYHKERLFLKGVSAYQYQAREYPRGDCVQSIIELENHDGASATLLLPADALPVSNDAGKACDWISDDQLILALADVLRAGEQPVRDEVAKLAKAASELTESNADVTLTEERKTRLQALSKDIGSWNELADGVLSEVMSDEAILEKLSGLAVERHLERLKEKLAEDANIREHMEKLGQEEARLQRSVEELQRREADLLNRVPRQEIAQAGAQTSGAIREQEATLAEYERKIQDARVQYDYERGQKDKLDASLSALIRRYKDEAGQIVRLFDRKILDGLVGESSSAPSPAQASASVTEPPQFYPALLHAPMSREEIVNRVTDYLRNCAGRRVSYNDVINYLLCLTQGFITTFAGAPGCGKTTLCTLLAKALGLSTNDAQNRYVEIPVERGWTSHRDFIGTVIPETNALRVKNMEVWEAMARLARENDDSCAYPPFLILLDEANLSPPEHYWSAFLRNCDINVSAKRMISIGGNHIWTLPEHLRFLATVNFDHTTEKLSPRFLDRAWVIMLDSFSVMDNAPDTSENIGDMVSYRSLQEAFRSTPSSAIDSETERKWNAFRDIFQRRGLPITPRGSRMVRDYCATACGCMTRDTPETRMAPLDYAFSQKILPMISGQGENYRELIYDLRRECAEATMPLSARHLEQMQRISDNNQGFYRFFR